MPRIHPDAERTHFDRNPQHRAIVRPFLSGFAITRGFWKARGDDRIACFYLKPEPFIAELVGIEREMLMVYAPFSEVQARSIKLHDEVMAEDRLRVDPIGSIFVCRSPETATEVRHFVESDPERPPMVAISTQELELIRTGDDLRSLLVQNLFRRDLFALESPLLTDTTYFGREEITAELLDRVRSGQNSGLFGLRRIGKTSVLFALGRRLEASNVAHGTFIDLSSPAIYGVRWWDLLRRIIREMAEPLRLERSDRSKVRALNVEYTSDNAAANFKTDILHLTKLVPSSRWALMLDEVETITFELSPASHWSDDFLPFWQTLRSVHQDLAGRFTFLVAGVNPKLLESDRVGRFDNPLFSTVKAYYLQPFELQALRSMVRKLGRFMGLRVEEEIYTRLLEEYGGHPFLVRQACSLLAKRVHERPGVLAVSLFSAERSRIAVALEKNVRQVLSVLAYWYPSEYELLRDLANGKVAEFVEFAQLNAAFTEHIEGYGLVENARTTPSIRIALVPDHLRQVPKRESGEVPKPSRDQILVEVSRRRNAIEEQLRESLRQGLRFARGPKAADAALAAVPEERRKILVQHGYNDLWANLYFNELASVVEKNWDAFERFFATDKAKVVGYLDHINRSRADAHAKQLSDEDLAYLRVCFRRLEEVLGLS